MTRSVDWSPRVYWSTVSTLATLTALLSVASVAWTPPGVANTVWWPATGVGVCLGLVYRGRAWHVLLFVGAAASLAFLVFGRPWSYVTMSAVLAITVVAVFLAAAHRLGPLTDISTTRDLGRFIAVTALGASGIGIVGGVAFWTILGLPPWAGFVFYFSAHFSAIALIAPIVLVPLRVEGVRRREEFATVVTLVVAVSIALFLDGSIVTASLVFPIMAWLALRGRPLTTVALVVVIGVVFCAVTAWGFGPFADARYSSFTTATVQLFLVSIAITVLAIVSMRSERAALRAEAVRRTQLLEGGFIASQVGLAVVRCSDSGLTFDVLEENAIAHDRLAHPEVSSHIQQWAAGKSAEPSTEVLLENGRAIEIYVRRLPGVDGEHILGVQIVDTTDAVALRESLRAAVDEYQALSLRKQAFIARMSHEFRTPITSILGFTEVLQESATDGQTAHLATIARNAARLRGLTEELLDASVLMRSDAVGRHDLNTLVAAAVERSGRHAQDRSVTIVVSETEGCSVDVAPTILNRLLDRLLERAIGSSPAGSIVSARSHVDGQYASITISDSGIALGIESTLHFTERLVREQSGSLPGDGHLPVGVSEAIAQLFGCELAVDDSPLGGVSVRLQFERAVDVPTAHLRATVGDQSQY